MSCYYFFSSDNDFMGLQCVYCCNNGQGAMEYNAFARGLLLKVAKQNYI